MPTGDIVALTKELISYHTTPDRPDELAACAERVARYLEENGLPCRRLNHQGVPSVLALPEEGRCRVLLMSHMDVVAAPNELFKPEERDGKLYGRGAIDDKYAAALSLVLMKEHLRRLQGQGRGVADLPFGVLITGDEETGGRYGACEALKSIRAEFCIALDGGGVDTVVVKEKGILRVRLRRQGRSAHGARPWLGDNAIEGLMADLQAVRELFREDTPDHWHRTMNLGTIKGGEVANMVPAEAEALLDIRYTENDDPDRILEEVRSRIAGEATLERHDNVFRGGGEPYLDLLLQASPGTQLGHAHGASDARFLSENNIPGVVWGADGDTSQHSENEHLNIDSLVRLHERLDRFLWGLAG